jgi:8-oxo-dGTP pyrophosphatase MutT (NUDIX family)
MPHLHKLYDFVTSVFIVNRGAVLMVFHKKYKEWLPIGGHIEMDEDPEQALFREIQEECGLKVKILAPRPKIAHPGVKPIYTPNFVDVHRISDTHKHIAFIYNAVSRSRDVLLLEREHREYRWFTPRDIKNPKYKLIKSIRFYCRRALKDALEYES